MKPISIALTGASGMPYAIRDPCIKPKNQHSNQKEY